MGACGMACSIGLWWVLSARLVDGHDHGAVAIADGSDGPHDDRCRARVQARGRLAADRGGAAHVGQGPALAAGTAGQPAKI